MATSNYVFTTSDLTTDRIDARMPSKSGKNMVDVHVFRGNPNETLKLPGMLLIAAKRVEKSRNHWDDEDVSVDSDDPRYWSNAIGTKPRDLANDQKYRWEDDTRFLLHLTRFEWQGILSVKKEVDKALRRSYSRLGSWYFGRQRSSFANDKLPRSVRARNILITVGLTPNFKSIVVNISKPTICIANAPNNEINLAPNQWRWLTKNETATRINDFLADSAPTATAKVLNEFQFRTGYDGIADDTDNNNNNDDDDAFSMA